MPAAIACATVVGGEVCLSTGAGFGVMSQDYSCGHRPADHERTAEGIGAGPCSLCGCRKFTRPAPAAKTTRARR